MPNLVGRGEWEYDQEVIGPDEDYRNVRVGRQSDGAADMTTTTMHIGELAERTGLSLRTIRHYDEVGILKPTGRTDGGFRLYTAEDESRLLLIRRMKPLGYSLEETGQLLELIDALTDNPYDEELRARLELVRAEASDRRDRLRAQLEAADEFLEQLRRR
jgi:MerR family copper efflux transcriptional regulator